MLTSTPQCNFWLVFVEILSPKSYIASLSKSDWEVQKTTLWNTLYNALFREKIPLLCHDSLVSAIHRGITFGVQTIQIRVFC